MHLSIHSMMQVTFLYCAAYDTEAVLCSAGGEALNMQVPANINRFLRSYQRDGVRFLFRQYAQNKGGILADDMGLGKTVQTIGFLAAILGKTGTNADLQANTSDKPEGYAAI